MKGLNFDVVINTDNNYVQHCMAMLQSLYYQNKNHKISLHVLTYNLDNINKHYLSEITARYNNDIFFYRINEEILDGVQFRKNRPLSKAAYYRLLLSSTLPQNIEKVLYLDCDMIVMGDVSELFELEINNYALAATLDDFPYSNQHRLQLHMDMMERTFCSGMMLVNLKYWRENNCEPLLLEYATKRIRKEIYLHDQDVLNYVFKSQWFMLPPKWNKNAGQLKPLANYWYKSFDINEYLYNPKIIHYAAIGKKPWYNVSQPDRKPYLDALKESGYKPVVFTKITFFKKIELLREYFEYLINKYVVKFIPNIILIIIYDIIDLIKLPVRIARKTGVYKTLKIK